MKFLFIPAPEAGHLLPTVPVARRLMASGCAVTYLVSVNHVSSLRGCELDAHSYSGDIGKGVETQPLYAQGMTGSTAWQKEWHSVSAERRTSDLVLSRVAELAMGSPFDLVVLDRLFYRKPSGLLEGLKRSGRVAILSTSMLRLEGEKVLDAPSTIVLCPSDLVSPSARQHFARAVYAEPSIEEDRSEVPFQLASLIPDTPLVLCSFGSQGDRHPEIGARARLMREVAQLLPSMQFMVATGRMLEKERQERVPPNLFYRSYIPLYSLLGRATLLVTHGGLGSLKEAIYYGVPMICWPLCCDQPFNAKCIQTHQLGGALVGETVAAETIADLICSVTACAEIRTNLMTFQRIFREKEAHPIAAMRLQELARVQHP